MSWVDDDRATTAGATALLLLVLLACRGSGSTSANSPDSQPEECRANALEVVAAGLEGAANKGQNQTVERFHDRCERAKDRQALERAHQEEMEVRRQELELLQQQAAARQAERERAIAAAEAEAQAAQDRRRAQTTTQYRPEENTQRPARASDARTMVLIFGGKDHSVFLGCLMCGAEGSSLFNTTGQYGSCPLLAKGSLFCHGFLDEYGSPGIVSEFSACSSMGQEPPVIVDREGNYFGRFSVAQTSGHDDSVCAPMGNYLDPELCELVKAVCVSGDFSRFGTDN